MAEVLTRASMGVISHCSCAINLFLILVFANAAHELFTHLQATDHRRPPDHRLQLVETMMRSSSLLPPRSRCLSLCDVSAEVFSQQSSLSERQKQVETLIVEAAASGFQDGQFSSQCQISVTDTLIVSCYFLIVMGLPLGLFGTFCILLFVGTWSSLLIFVFVSAVLAFHPLPKMSHENNFHPLCVIVMRAMFR